MDAKESIDKLWAAMVNFDWFADQIEINPALHKSLIVYVDKMDKNVLECVPDQIDDFNVRIHFAASIDDKYAAKTNTNKSANSLIDFVSLMDYTSFEN